VTIKSMRDHDMKESSFESSPEMSRREKD